MSGGAALWRFLTPRRGAAAATARLCVPLADVPADGALVLPDAALAIVRQEDAVHALDLACTHLGCQVRATVEGFTCPCHGSRFAPDGTVREGPATRPLTRLAVDVDAEGRVVIGGIGETASCAAPTDVGQG